MKTRAICRRGSAPARRNQQLGRIGERLKREVLRSLLPPRLARLREPYFLCETHHSVAEVRQRLAKANVVGVGFGLKESGGAFAGTLAVRVYVRRKVPKGRLARGVRIPPTVAGYPTDVISAGQLRWQARPVPVGGGISAENGERGSLGCVVGKAGSPLRYLLTSAHVLLLPPDAALGELVVEPPTGQAGSTRLAVLTDFEPLLDDGTDNLMDAAMAQLDNPADVFPAPLPIGTLDPRPLEPALYESVRKVGAATGHTLGVVSDAQANVTMNGSVRYRNLFEIQGCEVPFSKGGDSGALIVDALTNRPVGLIVGGNDQYRTYAVPISRVLARFAVSIIA